MALTYHKLAKPKLLVQQTLQIPKEYDVSQGKAASLSEQFLGTLSAKQFEEQIALQLPSPVLDAFTMQVIEGYIAHKWQCQDKLDAGHPFKYSPPIPPISLFSQPKNGFFKFHVGKYADKYPPVVQTGDGA